MPGIGQIGTKGGRVAASAIVGGSASALGGGKFLNGAVTAAFSRLYNDETIEEKKKLRELNWDTFGPGDHEFYGSGNGIGCYQFELCRLRLNELDDLDLLDEYLLSVDLDIIPGKRFLKSLLGVGIVKEFAEYQLKNSFCAAANATSCDTPKNAPVVPSRDDVETLIEKNR